MSPIKESGKVILGSIFGSVELKKHRSVRDLVFRKLVHPDGNEYFSIFTNVVKNTKSSPSEGYMT
ncbi:35855_t:CDS:1, partial [Racocetra persica]